MHAKSEKLAAVYGVPALAGRLLPFEDGSKYLEIHDQTSSDRLKPGLHTLCPSFECELCGQPGGRSGKREERPPATICQPSGLANRQD